MVEVKAQLVGADVGTGLADVVAKPLAQRGVKQMRGGVVALCRVASGCVNLSDELGPDLGRLAQTLDDQRLIVTSPDHTDDGGEMNPVSRDQLPGVSSLPAAFGIERRVGQLDQRSAILLGDPNNVGPRAERLVADEARLLAANRANSFGRNSNLALACAGRRARPLLSH